MSLKGILIGIVLLGLAGAAALGVWGVRVYNALQREQVRVDQSWAQVENVYQRRADLIPNLVETVKGYAAHEQTTLTDVLEARAKATSVRISADDLKDPQALQRFQEAQGQLTGALSRLLGVAESYPNLKANQNFLALQDQLEGAENRIAVERKAFNDAVAAYNTHIRMFPASVIAGFAGLAPRPFFEAEEGARTVPKVSFQ